MDNYGSFMKLDTSGYVDEWVVLCDGEVVAHGKDIKKAVAEAKAKCSSKRLMIAKIPSEETMIC